METTEEESTGQPWQVVLAPVPATGREAKAEGRRVPGRRPGQWLALGSCSGGPCSALLREQLAVCTTAALF